MKRLVDALRQARSIKGAIATSLLNQALSSGTNFVMVIYLVRVMDKTGFGVYSLGFAVLLLLAGLINSSISVQYVVNLPEIPEAERVEYALHHAMAAVVPGLLLVLGGLLVAPLLDQFAAVSTGLSAMLFPTFLAAALYSQRDFLMRVAFSGHREISVLASTVAMALGVSGGIVVQWQSGTKMTPDGAMYITAFGQLTGCVTGLGLLRLPYRKFRLQGMRDAMRDAWKGGRWNILTNVVYSVRSQAHNLVVAPLLGLAGVAEMNATRVLVTPALLAIPPLTQVLMPRLAAKRTAGTTQLMYYAAQVVGGLLAFSLVYAAVLLLLMPWVLPLALGEAYRHEGALVMAWCLVAIVMAVRNGLAMVLQVMRSFRELLVANVMAAVVALIAAAIFALALGGMGAVIGLALAEGFLCLLLLLVLRRKGDKRVEKTVTPGNAVVDVRENEGGLQ